MAQKGEAPKRQRHEDNVQVSEQLVELWTKFMDGLQAEFQGNQLSAVLSKLTKLEVKISSISEEKPMVVDESRVMTLGKQIFENHLDLLTCRLVSSLWNRKATEVLLKGEKKLTFDLRPNAHFYLRGSNWRSLDMLTQLLRTSRNFPCDKFFFWGGNLQNDDSQRFFSVFGPSIKTLIIYLGKPNDEPAFAGEEEPGFSRNKSSSKVIGNILFHQAPNVQTLLLNILHGWDGELLFGEREETFLPYLSKIIYDSDMDVSKDGHFLFQLLTAAKNLQSFDFEGKNFNVAYSDILIAAGKVGTVRTLEFPSNSDSLDKLEEMMKYESKLMVLDLNAFRSKIFRVQSLWEKSSRILSRLLDSNKNSLKRIMGFYRLGFLPQLQLPVLCQVPHLFLLIENVDNVQDDLCAFLPRESTFSQNFPRLTSLTIFLIRDLQDDRAAALWPKCFPVSETVPTVKKLQFRHPPVSWVDGIRTMFPNIQDLELWHIVDFPALSRALWRFKKGLKRLQVKIDLSSPLNRQSLDSCFTAFSIETCQRRENLSDSEIRMLADHQIEKPSILELQDLEKLEVDLIFSSGVPNYDYPTVLTRVTTICALDRLPKLRRKHCVNIKVQDVNAGYGIDVSRIREALQRLASHSVKVS